MSGSFADALKMRTPAYTHAALTYLDCLKYEMSYLEEFLILANSQGILDDPVERIKFITVA
jgi:hypothetical protein